MSRSLPYSLFPPYCVVPPKLGESGERTHGQFDSPEGDVQEVNLDLPTRVRDLLCQQCGTASGAGDRFCRQCGARLAGQDRSFPEISSSKKALVAERRLVTALFCDLVGSTELSHTLDPEDFRELLIEYHGICGQCAQRQDGHIAQYLGDGFLAYFGYPRAHEDDACRAIRCALEIRNDLERLTLRGNHRLVARFGADSGTVVVSTLGGAKRHEDLALGDTPNVAARTQARAEPGEVLVSERTWRLVQGYFRAQSVGRPTLKGVAQPLELWRIEGETLARTRLDAAQHLSPFTGRDRELQDLERYCADREPGVRLLDVVGEPGIGKSRLLAELVHRLREQRRAWLRGNCMADRQETALGPFLEILRSMLLLEPGETGSVTQQKVVQLLRALELDTPERRALVANLLDLPFDEGALAGLDGTLIALRTRDLLVTLLVAYSRNHNLSILLEDAHWMDAVSEQLLMRILAHSQTVSMRFVVTHRPEYRPPWHDSTSVQRLTLGRLSVQDAAAIVASRLGAKAQPPLADQLARRAEGNALFAEELATYVRSKLAESEGRTGDPHDSLLEAVPDTIRGLLDARVDLLSASDRTLLQAASVIGRRFGRELLSQVLGSSEDLAPRLDRLVRMDLLHREPDGDQYLFKHSLVQDALYSSLLRHQAAALHERVARKLERRYAESLNEVAEALAFHYRHTDCYPEAVTALTRAGEKALTNYALEEALAYLEGALRIVQQHEKDVGPERLLLLLFHFCRLRYLRFEVRRLKELVDAYIDTLSQFSDRVEYIYLLADYVVACALMHDFASGRLAADRLRLVACRISDRVCRVYADASFAFMHCLLADIPREQIQLLLENASRVVSDSSDSHANKWISGATGWSYVYHGQNTAVRALALSMTERGVRLSDPGAQAVGLWLCAFVNIYNEQYKAGLEQASHSIELSLTPFDRLVGQNAKGICMVFLGSVKEGLAALADFDAKCIETGFLYGLMVSFGARAAGLLFMGRFREGFAMVDAAIDRCRAIGDGHCLAQAQTFKAELLLAILGNGRRPSLGIILRNLAFILRTHLRGAKEAEALLRAALEHRNFNDSSSYWFARIQTNLALLYSMTGKIRLAKPMLERALELAKARQAPALIAKIERALESTASQ